MELRAALARVVAGKDLTREEAERVMTTVMNGEATPAQLGALLAALHLKGESSDEVAGFAGALRAFAVPVELTIPDAIDTCGTGGDGAGTFNISTIAAMVCAGAGAPVAKHGNRAASSACGSADVLEALGVRIDLGPKAVARCIEDVGVGFMFAPRFHPAMRHAGPVRRELGVRTVFNLLGPLVNPARVRRQLLGVATPRAGPLLAESLRALGAQHVLVAHGEDGLDEISPSGPSRLWELRDGHIEERSFHPEDVGLRVVAREEISGGDIERNKAIAQQVLAGADGGRRTAVLLNAGAALYVAGKVATVADGVALAGETIDSGRARNALARLAQRSHELIGEDAT